MDKDKTHQKRDRETGDWVSDLNPGATAEAKLDKGVEDTFPASDPAPKPVATSFISPDGEDTAQSADKESESSSAAKEGNSGMRRSAAASVNQQPLTALLTAGVVGWVLDLLANGRQ
jgi:hypothetical protein